MLLNCTVASVVFRNNQIYVVPQFTVNLKG